jgi:hypothetical protein
MPSQTHRRRNKNRRQQRNSRNRARSSKLSLTNSEYGLGLAGSIVGVSALSQGSELIDQQHNNEVPSQQQMFIGEQGGGKGRGSDSAEYILRFLEMLNTIKIYHWSTLSYPTHKATDELHSKMSELVDSFIEIYIGHLSRRGGGAGAGIPVFKRGAASEISFCECKSLDIFCKKLDGYITFMEGLTKRLDGYTDLVNIRDEMVGAVAQTLYLLRLK